MILDGFARCLHETLKWDCSALNAWCECMFLDMHVMPRPLSSDEGEGCPFAALYNIPELFPVPEPGLPEHSPEEGILPEESVSGALRDLYQPAGGEQPHPPSPRRIHHRALHL